MQTAAEGFHWRFVCVSVYLQAFSKTDTAGYVQRTWPQKYLLMSPGNPFISGSKCLTSRSRVSVTTNLHFHCNNDGDWISRLHVVTRRDIHLVDNPGHRCYGSPCRGATVFRPAQLQKTGRRKLQPICTILHTNTYVDRFNTFASWLIHTKVLWSACTDCLFVCLLAYLENLSLI